MSVPPEVLQQAMAGGGAPQAAGGQPPQTGATPPTGGGQPPGASPMSQPQDKQGLKAAAMTNISIMQNMAEQALTAFAPEDKEYKVLLKCLNALAPLAAARDSSDLVPAEVARMVGQLPQMGGGTDIQRKIMQQMNQARQPAAGPQ